MATSKGMYCSLWAGSKSSNTPPAWLRRRSIFRQSGVILARSPTSTHFTCQPISSSSRAAATPSPPLLPGPHHTMAERRRMAQNSACSSGVGMWPSAVSQPMGPSSPGPGMGRARTSRTTARAAFSIS